MKMAKDFSELHPEYKQAQQADTTGTNNAENEHASVTDLFSGQESLQQMLERLNQVETQLGQHNELLTPVEWHSLQKGINLCESQLAQLLEGWSEQTEQLQYLGKTTVNLIERQQAEHFQQAHQLTSDLRDLVEKSAAQNESKDTLLPTLRHILSSLQDREHQFENLRNQLAQKDQELIKQSAIFQNRETSINERYEQQNQREQSLLEREQSLLERERQSERLHASWLEKDETLNEREVLLNARDQKVQQTETNNLNLEMKLQEQIQELVRLSHDIQFERKQLTDLSEQSQKQIAELSSQQNTLLETQFQQGLYRLNESSQQQHQDLQRQIKLISKMIEATGEQQQEQMAAQIDRIGQSLINNVPDSDSAELESIATELTQKIAALQQQSSTQQQQQWERVTQALQAQNQQNENLQQSIQQLQQHGGQPNWKAVSDSLQSQHQLHEKMLQALYQLQKDSSAPGRVHSSSINQQLAAKDKVLAIKETLIRQLEEQLKTKDQMLQHKDVLLERMNEYMG